MNKLSRIGYVTLSLIGATCGLLHFLEDYFSVLALFPVSIFLSIPLVTYDIARNARYLSHKLYAFLPVLAILKPHAIISVVYHFDELNSPYFLSLILLIAGTIALIAGLFKPRTLGFRTRVSLSFLVFLALFLGQLQEKTALANIVWSVAICSTVIFNDLNKYVLPSTFFVGVFPVAYFDLLKELDLNNLSLCAFLMAGTFFITTINFYLHMYYAQDYKERL